MRCRAMFAGVLLAAMSTAVACAPQAASPPTNTTIPASTQSYGTLDEPFTTSIISLGPACTVTLDTGHAAVHVTGVTATLPAVTGPAGSTVHVDGISVTIPAQSIVASSAYANCLSVTSTSTFTLTVPETTATLGATVDLATGLVTFDSPSSVVVSAAVSTGSLGSLTDAFPFQVQLPSFSVPLP